MSFLFHFFHQSSSHVQSILSPAALCRTTSILTYVSFSSIMRLNIFQCHWSYMAAYFFVYSDIFLTSNTYRLKRICRYRNSHWIAVSHFPYSFKIYKSSNDEPITGHSNSLIVPTNFLEDFVVHASVKFLSLCIFFRNPTLRVVTQWLSIKRNKLDFSYCYKNVDQQK